MLIPRVARPSDVITLTDLVAAAVVELQREFLEPAQIEASRTIMGLDARLIEDGTYFVVECGGEIAGCGGWSRRATLYGPTHIAGRDDSLLDPSRDAARVRAMYTHPRFARRGVGRTILHQCEQAAAAEGFTRLELIATMAGRPLYEAFGFRPVEDVLDTSTGVSIPLLRMEKPIPRFAAPAL